MRERTRGEEHQAAFRGGRELTRPANSVGAGQHIIATELGLRRVDLGEIGRAVDRRKDAA